MRPRRRVRPSSHRDHAVPRLRARQGRTDPPVQRRLRARDGIRPRRGARPRRSRLRHPARGSGGVRRSARARLEDGTLQPAGRPLADQGRRSPPDRLVEQADAGRRRRADLPRHDGPRLDRTRRRGRRRTRLRRRPRAKLAEVGRLAQEQRALRRVATLVASEASPERVFTAVSEEAARVLEVNASAVFRYEGDDTVTIVGRHSRHGAGDAFKLGMRLPATEDTGIGQVLRTGAPARVHDYTERPGEIADNMRLMSYRSSVSAPIVVAGILWGAVGIASAEPLPVDTEARLGAFCELVSLAVASAQARADLSASRARLVKTGDEQRRKLERNLHDGAQQRLVSVALTIRLARRQLESDSDAAAASLEGAAKELDLALEELRELARGLHPAALTEQGLGPALAGVAQRLPIEVDVDAPDGRLPENIEATAYYIVTEALTNVVKHAQATKAKVDMTLAGDVLKFEVTDDGRGGADPSGGSGILGLRDRAEAVGGTLFVISPPGKGTVVTAQLPFSGA